MVGSTHYSLIRGLLSPELPKDKSFKDLDILKKQYDLESIIIVERFHFYEWNQKPGKSIANYLVSLRQLASWCDFVLSDVLWDQLVCGMSNENIQKVLFTKAKLTLEEAAEISQGMEAAALQSKELRGSLRSTSQMLAIQTPSKPCGWCRCGNHSERWGILRQCADLR